MTHTSILITGGAGFIGSNLIDKIIDQYKIICVDNFNNYYNPVWKQDNIKEFINHHNFILKKVDVRNYDELDQIFKEHKIDKIIHLAARAGVRPSIENPLLYQNVNIKGTLNLLELARIYKIPHFIGASSSSVYGNQEKIPFSETDEVDHPISPYAASKKSIELFCYTYAHLYKIKTTCLRFFTVYGPKGRPDMAPYLFTKAILTDETINKFGDGSSRRDYTYIDDIVDGIIKTIEKEFDFEIFNLGNNKPITLNQFIKHIEIACSKQAIINQIEMQQGDVNQTYADISKAKKLLNWQPKVNFQKGIQNFVNWYKENRL